jgi:hypothetical protein
MSGDCFLYGYGDAAECGGTLRFQASRDGRGSVVFLDLVTEPSRAAER